MARLLRLGYPWALEIDPADLALYRGSFKDTVRVGWVEVTVVMVVLLVVSLVAGVAVALLSG